MSKFKVKNNVILNHSGESYRGYIMNQNDFRPPEMEYVVMLEDKTTGCEKGMVFVGEDELELVLDNNTAKGDNTNE